MAATPARRPAEWVRVKSKATGHKFTVAASMVDEERYHTLKQDALDTWGNPLPPEYATTTPQTSADPGEKTEGRGAAKSEGEGK